MCSSTCVNECEMPILILYGSGVSKAEVCPVVVLFGKVVNPLGGGVSLKEEFTEREREL